MPCSSGAVPAIVNADVTDLLVVHPFKAGTLYSPQTRAELVTALLMTARSGRSLRAHGSNWSLSPAGVADDVADTSALGLHICQPHPAPTGQPLPAGRIRGAASDFVAESCARHPQTAGRHYVHVEAGIKIRQLLDDLAHCGLALPTMGDGAGQSLVGALSTATHGGDLRVPPLADWARAVHLISSTGQEIWVTPTGSPFASEPLVLALPESCPDMRFISDDDTFDAVRVGVGRMGLVYSLVLEVVPQYTLIEVNLEHRWSHIRSQLVTSELSKSSVTGIFDRPLTNLDSGWFRSEILSRTYYPAVVVDPRFTYVPGAPKWPGVPAYFDKHPEVYPRLLADLKLTTLADDLRNGAPMPLHHIQLVISLAEPDRCWMRRRWKRTEAVRAVAVAPLPDGDLVAKVKSNKSNPPGIVDALKELVEIDDAFLNFFGWLTHNDRKQRLDWYLDQEIAHIAQQHAQAGYVSGEALFLILQRMATDPVLEAGQEIAAAVSGVIGGAYARPARGGPASGAVDNNMLDAHDYGLDGAQIGNSAEFQFDAASTGYLRFIDAIVALSRQHFPVFGYIGIRFTPASTALVAMQQFEFTVSVEIATPRSRLDNVYAAFWSDVHDVARDHRGIPHWGQEIHHDAAELAALYGNRLLRWRKVLADIATDGVQVFSTAFSREKGLEPYTGVAEESDDEVELFLLGLEAAVD